MVSVTDSIERSRWLASIGWLVFASATHKFHFEHLKRPPLPVLKGLIALLLGQTKNIPSNRIYNVDETSVVPVGFMCVTRGVI